MRVQADETSTSVVAFGPKKGPPDATMVADDAGRGIVALVQKAADLAKTDCNRLRTAEERAREFEAQANYFRDRAAHAEEWLLRIHGEVQQMFFQKNEQRPPVSQAKKRCSTSADCRFQLQHDSG